MLTLLHTSPVHRPTFNNLQADLAPDLLLHHVVRPDWLERAQAGIDARLEAEIAETIHTAPGPVLCTCSTLGPVAARYGATRIDAPMMAEAAAISGDVMLVYALETTRATSLDLLAEALSAAGRQAEVHVVDLSAFWPLFAAGELTAFHASLAAGVRDALRTSTGIGCVVLAQASMAGAAALLSDLPQPVLSSPRSALLHMIASA